MKISIIIPTIGRDSLKEVLNGVFECEDFKNIDPEILVVFDGVNEANLTSQDSNLKILETKTKSFSAGARNLGIKEATGDVLVFLGDDTLPDKLWLKKINAWHLAHPSERETLLGRVYWSDELRVDPFHQWLDQGVQFDFGSLEKGTRPNWRHFYTSNISLKKSLINKLETPGFNEDFKGWGFEDSELGYRLQKIGNKIYFDQDIRVTHDHKQDLDGLVKRTKEAQENAVLFESLHPEIKLRPYGAKKTILKIVIHLMDDFNFLMNQEKRWWREWKRAWVN